MKSNSTVVVASFSFSLLFLLMTVSAGATNYTLTLTRQGSGTIYRNPTNSSYPAGVTVIITGVANPGWYFANWTGDTNSSLNPLNVVINSGMNVTGNFVAYPTYTLLLATNGEGTVGLSPSGGSYLSNTVVTATATAATGWVFAEWSGATNSVVNPVSLAVNANGTLTGTFAELPAFDVEPVSVTNRAGSTVSFTSHAVGTGLLSYQWYFSGGTIETVANNSTLSLTNVGPGQAGAYWVVVTNNYGSATSQVVSLTVTNSAGPANIVSSPTEASLVAAIQTGGWIGIGFNGTLTLTNTITITNNVILDGTGVAATISGGNTVQLFYVTSTGSLTITNLTLANGSLLITNISMGTTAEGGAIYNNAGLVTLVECTVTNCSAKSLIYGGGAGYGGAIFNNGGTVWLSQSFVLNNTAIGGGSYAGSSGGSYSIGAGGAIYNTGGSVILADCTVSGNLCQGFPYNYGIGYVGNGLTLGGAVFQSSGALTITNSSFSQNDALGGAGGYEGEGPGGSPAQGGALAVTGGSLAIDLSQFSSNEAIAGGAFAGGAASGGAVYCTTGWTATDSAFFDNQVIAGGSGSISKGLTASAGGIYNGSTLSLNRCSVYANAVQGGGTASEFATIGGDGLGGGIYNAGQMAATNCTVALNAAIGGPGYPQFPNQTDVTGNGIGGGICNGVNATSVLMNLTIAANSCSSPATSIYSEDFSTNGFAAGSQIANTNGSVQVHNTLIAYGTNNNNTYGPITDVGYNICSDGSASLFSGSSYNYTDPQLAPLGNYGGPTLCMALLPTSPAIDNGDPSDFPATDQRGYVRPFGSGPDMGAYEFGSAPSTVPYVNLGVASTNVVLSFSAFASHTYYLQGSTNLTTWVNLSTNGPFAVSTYISQTVSKKSGHGWFFRLLMQ